jgi:hypothetical protein
MKSPSRNADPQEAVNASVRYYAEARHRRRAVRVIIYLDDDTKCLWPIPEFDSADPVDNQCRLSDDGRTLLWFGRRFTFTRTQSPVIAMLLSAWEEGTRDVAQDVLLRAADSDSLRLEYLFRRNTAWGVIVVAGDGAGMYRLAEPDEISSW